MLIDGWDFFQDVAESNTTIWMHHIEVNEMQGEKS